MLENLSAEKLPATVFCQVGKVAKWQSGELCLVRKFWLSKNCAPWLFRGELAANLPVEKKTYCHHFQVAMSCCHVWGQSDSWDWAWCMALEGPCWWFARRVVRIGRNLPVKKRCAMAFPWRIGSKPACRKKCFPMPARSAWPFELSRGAPVSEGGWSADPRRPGPLHPRLAHRGGGNGGEGLGTGPA